MAHLFLVNGDSIFPEEAQEVVEVLPRRPVVPAVRPDGLPGRKNPSSPSDQDFGEFLVLSRQDVEKERSRP